MKLRWLADQVMDDARARPEYLANNCNLLKLIKTIENFTRIWREAFFLTRWLNGRDRKQSIAHENKNKKIQMMKMMMHNLSVNVKRFFDGVSSLATFFFFFLDMAVI